VDKKKPPKKRERGTPDCHRAPASFGSNFKGLWVTPLLSQPEHFPVSPWVTPTFELRRRFQKHFADFEFTAFALKANEA
jgi:hypothetical protein